MFLERLQCRSPPNPALWSSFGLPEPKNVAPSAPDAAPRPPTSFAPVDGGGSPSSPAAAHSPAGSLLPGRSSGRQRGGDLPAVGEEGRRPPCCRGGATADGGAAVEGAEGGGRRRLLGSADELWWWCVLEVSGRPVKPR
jgi:hypothetical protein